MLHLGEKPPSGGFSLCGPTAASCEVIKSIRIVDLPLEDVLITWNKF